MKSQLQTKNPQVQLYHYTLLRVAAASNRVLQNQNKILSRFEHSIPFEANLPTSGYISGCGGKFRLEVGLLHSRSK